MKTESLWKLSRRATATMGPLRRKNRGATAGPFRGQRRRATAGPLMKQNWRTTRQTEPFWRMTWK